MARTDGIERTTVLVMAKTPVPGRVKTRLCPPCTPSEAATIAGAAIADTLAATLHAGARRVVLALDGEPGPWIPSGIELVAQEGRTFGQRLAAAWRAVGGPTVQIGMDTPQVTPELLAGTAAELHRPGAGSVLGPATDGGWWLLGMHDADPRVFDGIPMSRADTGHRQLARLHELGLEPVTVDALCDVDTFDEAAAVAASLPGSATASAVAAVVDRLQDGTRRTDRAGV